MLETMGPNKDAPRPPKGLPFDPFLGIRVLVHVQSQAIMEFEN